MYMCVCVGRYLISPRWLYVVYCTYMYIRILTEEQFDDFFMSVLVMLSSEEVTASVLLPYGDSIREVLD